MSLKDAFAGESQANRRYLYFAAKADKAGASLIAGIDHESYRVEVRPVAENIRGSLLKDLG